MKEKEFNNMHSILDDLPDSLIHDISFEISFTVIYMTQHGLIDINNSEQVTVALSTMTRNILKFIDRR